jgi:hypothetical protein
LKFVLIKQICTAKSFTRRWHARILYQALKTLRRSSPLYAAIVLFPPNISSIQFHEDAGFIRTFEFKDKDDEFRRAFWRCSRIDEGKNPDLLTHQHEVAADLYKHEDDLNWKKLSALFYISGALLAGIGVLLRPVDGSQIPRHLMFFIACSIGLLGLFMSSFFFVALRSGVDYMLHRKQTLIDIDGEIAKLNGIRMFIPVEMSRTAKYLRWISFAPTMFWFIVVSSIIYVWFFWP